MAPGIGVYLDLSSLSGHAGNTAYARQARLARAHRGHRHMIRRRAGWALISLGLRLAYVAGED